MRPDLSSSNARRRYPIAKSLPRLCHVLAVDPDRLVRRAGLPSDLLRGNERDISTEEWFALWTALEIEVADPAFPVKFGQMAVHSGFVPACFAFACSPTVATGLDRLARFKPLVGPIDLRTERDNGTYTITIGSPEGIRPLPPALLASEVVHFLELIRYNTGKTIAPVSASLSLDAGLRQTLEAFLGIPTGPGDGASLVFPEAVADLPLLTHDPDLWAVFEPNLRRQLADLETDTTIPERVHRLLLELLPSARATSREVAAEMGLSLRTLNRRLSVAGTTFQSVLTRTRTDLALHYLGQPEISLDEISYLLGFSDPNSFYRAFRSWTGQTPSQQRAAIRAEGAARSFSGST